MNKRFIIVHGPTGVGKTECITRIAQTIPIEIINGDMGQLYEPFSIGTAKPDWCNELVPHHLFDVLKEPIDYTAITYRAEVERIMHVCWERKTIPVIVGGTLFYGQSLFFPPMAHSDTYIDNSLFNEIKDTRVLWNQLHVVDPLRAEKIGPTDRYRIIRALQLIHQGLQPSTLEPVYNPIEGTALVIFLKRERSILYQRINERVIQMFEAGWIDEVRRIYGTVWQNFLERKKLIGYTEILTYIKEAEIVPEAYDAMVSLIQQKTRHYAKRQETFWRMLYKKLKRVETSAPLLCEIDLSDQKGMQMLEQTIKTFCS